MVYRHARGHTLWLDLEKPTREEIAEAMREVGVGKRIEDELLSPSPVPLTAAEGDAALLVLHFPAHAENDDAARDHEQEIDIVVGREFLITVRYEVLAPLHTLHKTFEAHELLGLAHDMSADAILEVICDKLFDSVRDHAKYVAGKMGKIEREMFAGKERETVRAISEVNREFLHLEAALADNEEPIERFLTGLGERGFFGSEFAPRKDRILLSRDHLSRLIITHRAVAAELQETNGALLNATQNEIMKTLTVITFIFLPLTLITGIFQMTVADVPLRQTPGAFWVILGIMAVVALLLTAFFSKKRWL